MADDSNEGIDDRGETVEDEDGRSELLKDEEKVDERKEVLKVDEDREEDKDEDEGVAGSQWMLPVAP
ncbi:hypothetical protein E2C01_017517 [Portunus trituberculatus]|uniref:Uncharacterized protein n=1 Tax=Portunus trituberculatus TaxID=210409 RepID=A0A5B7DU12_PORTR|nr:hypothetical protein [Portunus trituberculatus]